MYPNIKEMFNEKFSDFKNLLLYTPFDKRFRNSLPSEFANYMNEERFLDEFFVGDGIEQKINILKKQEEELTRIDDKSEEAIEELDIIKEKIMHLNAEKTKKSDFEGNIKNSSLKPFLIRGLSGSGKTTYLNFFVRKLEGEKVWINYDLFESTKSFILFGKDWKNEKFNFTQFKLLSIVLKTINDLLVKGDMSDIEYKNKISNIIINYNTLFYSQGNYMYEDLFSIFCDYNLGKISYGKTSIGSCESNLLDSLFTYFNNICSFNKKTSVNQINIMDILTELLQITVLILICIYGYFECNQFKMPTIYISFDNIEHYIDNNKVYDEDIVEITNMIYDFMTAQNNVLPIDFYKNFRIILLVRDTTDKMINPNFWHDEDFPNNSIDVSEWFDTFEIYKEKIKFFKKHGVLEHYKDIDEIEKALGYIFEDRFPRGINLIITNMYNSNKRRITRYLISALTLYIDRTKIYNKIWGEAISCSDKTLSQIYKHAARSIIKRSLLDLIESTQYFENLKSIEGIGTDSGLGIARRLLTSIHKYSMRNIVQEDTYIDFHSILSSIFDSPVHSSESLEIIKNKIEILVEILLCLNNPSIEETNWCQLIDVKIKRKAFNAQTKDNLIDILFEAYQKKITDEENCGIKITNAGKAFLSLCPEFEYFTCRYKSSRTPLFCSPDFTYALNTIKDIKKQTFKCVSFVIEHDRSFVATPYCYNYNVLYTGETDAIRPYLYSVNPFRKEQAHVLRIIDCHISYIDMYRTFVLSSINSNTDIKSVEKFSKEILDVITEYVKLLKSITEISSDCHGVMTYYLGGHKRTKGEIDINGKYYYQDYLDHLEKARKSLLDPSIRIIKN